MSGSGGDASAAESGTPLEFVDVLRTLKRAINKGGKLYNAGDHAGCYKAYLMAAREIALRSPDEQIRSILTKAIEDVGGQSNPTEQAWGLRVAFDLIKDRGRVNANAAGAPASASAAAKSELTEDSKAKAKEKAEKAAKQIRHVCTEIKQTEAAYVSDLQTIIHVFMYPARDERILDKDDVQTVFSNVEDLLRCNTALLEALEPLEKAEDSTELVAVIARAFSAVAPFFKLYTAYCAGYEGALKTLANCRQANPAFNTFLATQMKLPSCRGLALESFLIKPVQRLTKYPLFFKDLLKSIPEGNPSTAALVKASELVSTVSQSVDARIDDPSAKMAARLQPLGAEWLNLLAPHRELCLEFYCSVHSGGARFQATGYVFTDLLLVCKRKADGVLKPWLLVRLAQCMLGDVALLEETASGSGLYREEVTIEPEGGGGLFGKKSRKAETKFEWVLNVRVVGEEGWHLHCNSEDEMEELVNALDAALAKLHLQDLEKRRRMIKRDSHVQGDSEDVIKDLMVKLHQHGVRKGNRANEVRRDHKLEGTASINAKSDSKSGAKKQSKAGSWPTPDGVIGTSWVPAVAFSLSNDGRRRLQLSKLDVAAYAGKWYVVAHLPYFLERASHNQVDVLKWDAKEGRLTSEVSFNEGAPAGPKRTIFRQGAVTGDSGRDWRLRQRVGNLFLPQTPFYIVHMGAKADTMVLAHGDANGDSDTGHGLSYLWLMMRVSPADKSFRTNDMDELMDIAKQIGFDTSNLRIVPHT